MLSSRYSNANNNTFLVLRRVVLAVLILVLLLFVEVSEAFHDCIQASKELRQRRQRNVLLSRKFNNFYTAAATTATTTTTTTSPTSPSCAGGICIGMTNGPHQGGNASYPVAWNGTHGTYVRSYMTVPKLPQTKQFQDITYYIWTDVFFGDGLGGRMIQFVPQLLFGSVLDGSSGSPNYKPSWHVHNETWAFGAHYFFELENNTVTTNATDAHAAYGELYPAWPGETLLTTFDLVPGERRRRRRNNGTNNDNNDNTNTPKWILTMSVVGDDTRVSTLVVERPYMGMLDDNDDETNSSSSWTDPPYHNMCINACWELYGAKDSAHLPSGGATYDLTIQQPKPASSSTSLLYYPFTTWERDEGNGQCPSCNISESHNDTVQNVHIDISGQQHDNNKKEEGEEDDDDDDKSTYYDLY